MLSNWIIFRNKNIEYRDQDISTGFVLYNWKYSIRREFSGSYKMDSQSNNFRIVVF